MHTKALIEAMAGKAAGVGSLFKKAVGHVLLWEGGYANDPHDPGGETNYGISKRAHPELDIKNLTVEQAIEIYKKTYWDPYSVEKLPVILQLAHFDSIVNCGYVPAVKFLKAALGSEATRWESVAQAALAHPNKQQVLEYLLAERSVYYANLAKFPRYGRGWMRRAFGVATNSMVLSLENNPGLLSK